MIGITLRVAVFAGLLGLGACASPGETVARSGQGATSASEYSNTSGTTVIVRGRVRAEAMTRR